MDAQQNYERGKKMTYQAISSILNAIAVILLGTAFILHSLTISRLNKFCFFLSEQIFDLKRDFNKLRAELDQEGASENDTETEV